MENPVSLTRQRRRTEIDPKFVKPLPTLPKEPPDQRRHHRARLPEEGRNCNLEDVVVQKTKYQKQNQKKRNKLQT